MPIPKDNKNKGIQDKTRINKGKEKHAKEKANETRNGKVERIKIKIKIKIK